MKAIEQGPRIARIVAKLIDFALVMVLGAVLPWLFGPIFALAYSLCADGIKIGPTRGQSIGKKLLGLKVESISKSPPHIGIKESIIRNAPLGIITLFALIPIWGWGLLILAGIPIAITEVYLMYRMEHSQRFGDVMADTIVVQLAPRARSTLKRASPSEDN